MRPEDIRVGMVMISVSRGTRYTIECLNPKQCSFVGSKGNERSTGWDDKVVCNPKNFYWECEKESGFDRLYLTLKSK